MYLLLLIGMLGLYYVTIVPKLWRFSYRIRRSEIKLLHVSMQKFHSLKHPINYKPYITV